MDKRVQGLVALAAVVVIAVGGYLGFSEWQRRSEAACREYRAERNGLIRTRDEMQETVKKWDAGDKGIHTESLINLYRVMIPDKDQEITALSHKISGCR